MLKEVAKTAARRINARYVAAALLKAFAKSKPATIWLSKRPRNV
jgi:hypothetical protein